MSWIKKAKDSNKKEYQMPFVFYGNVLVEAEDESEAHELASANIDKIFKLAQDAAKDLDGTLNDYERQELVDTSTGK